VGVWSVAVIAGPRRLWERGEALKGLLIVVAIVCRMAGICVAVGLCVVSTLRLDRFCSGVRQVRGANSHCLRRVTIPRLGSLRRFAHVLG
jgi:hypothetical protein